jgi:hypothetical protein
MRDLAGNPLADDDLLKVIDVEGGAVVDRGPTDPDEEIRWRQALTDAGAERGMQLLFTGYDLVGIVDARAADGTGGPGWPSAVPRALLCEPSVDVAVDHRHPSQLPRLRLLHGGLDPQPGE